MRIAMMLAFAVLCGCNHDASPASPGGPRPDLGSTTTPDAATDPTDAAMARDAAQPSDAAQPLDMAESPDAATGLVTWTLSSQSGGAFYVDDDAVVTVDGTQVFSNKGAGATGISPITFQAKAGSTVTMSFFNDFGGAKSHDAVWLSASGITSQQVSPVFDGVGTSYPDDAIQPFYISVFTLPAPGQTATPGCLPDVALNTANWSSHPDLVIHTMTTAAYDATWTVDNHDYQYTPDCNGWVGDDFISTGNEWAYVQWNVITNELRTSVATGHPYNDTIAKSCADYAVQTLYPPGDLNMLTIQ
jgi:hypothetical protein